MRFSIATWNINSVRLRIDIVARFLEEQRPDVLCLQETKCPDAQFPFADFRKLGYEHIAINGQKGYHGVAIASRLPITASAPRDFCAKGDSRHMSVTLGGAAKGLTIHNFYVPAGGDEPDPAINDKFAHKLAFVDEMTAWFAAEPIAGRAILVGDLNIAPLEHDVWSHKALIKVVSHTPIEVEKLGRAQAAGPWVDALRKFVPAQEKLYTWWSYRAADWDKADKGRRLDHVWVSPALGDAVKSMRVFRDVRGWPRPSDHAPVMVELAL
ncbi:MAG: exodeoxyribonuclease III [Bradyrhizobium sp.]|nr:MAG: exodeoxyribonuclease III [Bradyrhizobium sp.]